MREKDLSVVTATLEKEFNIFREEGGESVPVRCQDDVKDVKDVKKNGKEGEGHRPMRK